MRSPRIKFAILTENIVDANGPSHSLLSLNGREHLGRILESDRAFTQGVADGKEVDESSRGKQSVKLSIANTLDKLTRQLVQFVRRGYPYRSAKIDRRLTGR